MCEKRSKKIKKGSHVTRLREARRLQRLQRVASPPIVNEPNVPPFQQAVEEVAQNRVILELAWKTVALMHKNRLIQQKIVALQKETSEFVAAVMNNPENRRRYLEHVRLYGIPQSPKIEMENNNDNNAPLKVEPE